MSEPKQRRRCPNLQISSHVEKEPPKRKQLTRGSSPSELRRSFVTSGPRLAARRFEAHGPSPEPPALLRRFMWSMPGRPSKNGECRRALH
eukprot:s1411_g4.t1